MTDFPVETGPRASAPSMGLPFADRQEFPGRLAMLAGRFGELTRYFLASAVALAVDAGTLVFCTEALGLHYLLSATIGFTLGVLVIYAISVRWVFAHRRLANRSAERAIFITIGILGLGLTDLVLYLLTDVIGLPYQLSKVGAAAAVFAFNFAARKAALFRAPTHPRS